MANRAPIARSHPLPSTHPQASSADSLKKALVGIAYFHQATDADEIEEKEILDRCVGPLAHRLAILLTPFFSPFPYILSSLPASTP